MPTMNSIYKDGVPYGGTPIAQTFGSETELTNDYIPEVTDDYSSFPALQSGTNSQSLWTKVASLFKNVRWINKILGNNTLDTTNKNVTGAINELNQKLGYIDTTDKLLDFNATSETNWTATKNCCIVGSLVSRNGKIARLYVDGIAIIVGANNSTAWSYFPVCINVSKNTQIRTTCENYTDASIGLAAYALK